MTDEVSEKIVVISFRAAIFTEKVLAKVLMNTLHGTGKMISKGLDVLKPKETIPKQKQGKQTVGQLISQGQGATTMEIDQKAIPNFNAILRKYKVDYAIQKDSTMNPPKYQMFFKAKDTDVMTQAFKEYLASEERRQARIERLQNSFDPNHEGSLANETKGVLHGVMDRIKDQMEREEHDGFGHGREGALRENLSAEEKGRRGRQTRGNRELGQKPSAPKKARIKTRGKELSL